jgi:PPOX class probable F420-dependent enzyme
MNDEEQHAFIREHRTAVFGFNRATTGPAMSLVYYATDPDGTIVVSTTKDRAKAKAAARDDQVSLCILDEQWPPSYLNVYCTAEVDLDEDTAADTMMRIGGVMAGAALDESLRPVLAESARKERRVTLRLRPSRAFSTPPKST